MGLQTGVPDSGNSEADSSQYQATEATEAPEYTRYDREYYLRYQGEHWDRCHNCKLVFNTFEEAVAHFEERCPFLWCKRCEVTFKTPEDREDHFIHGSAHWRCGVCKYDAPAVDVQERHWRQTNHKLECRGCNYWYAESYWNKHLRTSHACSKCHKHNGNEEQRMQHEAEHAKESDTFRCIGRCGKEFPTVGGMYSHLESGLCESAIDYYDVLRCFALHQGAEYLLVKDRKGILKRIFEGKEVHASPFTCPGKECTDETFKYFSAFLQHTQGTKCTFAFNKSGPESMLVHMENNLFLDTAIAKIKSMADNTRSGIQVLSLVPENPRDRAHATIPSAEFFRPFFTNITRYVQVCMKELTIRPSNDIKRPGVLKIRILKSFNRELEYLEKIYYKGHRMYTEGVTNAQPPHGDILIYFQSNRSAQPAWKYLSEVKKLIRLFRLMVDFDSPHYYQHY
ncbi:hypothetical protein TWF281_000626 [Arthrobotrys megalospora]